MSTELKAGEEVRVKSGGPPMTVVKIADENGTLTAWCVWHTVQKKMEDTFPVAALVKVTRNRKLPFRMIQLIPPGPMG